MFARSLGTLTHLPTADMPAACGVDFYAQLPPDMGHAVLLKSYVMNLNQYALPVQPLQDKPTAGVNSGAPAAAVPLTWQELKYAAESGFDELLRAQDEAAAAGGDDADNARRYRSPYKSPLRGGMCKCNITRLVHPGLSSCGVLNMTRSLMDMLEPVLRLLACRCCTY